ncbi:MAG: prolipoprotein diacylglyceryl transferase, partial [Candidatus Azambacteria bacterium]|nr:prolipoprotein diacylglyceryl transferase [Candidatus Azambacteria bacterium]
MFGFHWYGLIIGIGVLASIQASVWLAKRRGVNEEILWNASWWVLIGGLIGARLYHVLDLWPEVYSLDPISALYIWNGGLGIIGGLIGGFIGLWLFNRFMIHDSPARNASHSEAGGRFKNFVDIAIFGLPIGQAIGRIGNFINQEVYGLPTDLLWGIYINP